MKLINTIFSILILLSGVLSYVFARVLATLRSILPKFFGQLIAPIELSFYINAHIVGFGIDEAVSSDIRKDPDLFVPCLLSVVTKSPLNSFRQSNALTLLLAFSEDKTVREKLRSYAISKNSPEFNDWLSRFFNIVIK